MKNYLLLFVFILFFQISCNSHKTDQSVEKISFNEENNMNIVNKKYIKLETNNNCLIAYINQFEIVNNHIFILDCVSKKLYVFDLKGKYITHIGLQGNGPNEYIYITLFSIDYKNETISILDKNQLSILTYDLNTFKFIKRKNIPNLICDFELLSENKFVLFGYTPFTPPKKAHHYYITDSLFQIKSMYMPIEFESGHIYPPFKNMYKLNNKTFGFIRFRNYIYEITDEGATPKYELSIAQYKFPPVDFLESEVRTGFNSNYMPGLMESEYISLYNISENNNLLCMDYTAGKKNYIGVYNKENKQSYNYSIVNFQNRFKVPGIEKIVGRSEESIAIMLRPHLISNQIDDGAECDDELKELMKDSTPEDNPIIFLFNI